MSNDAYAVDPTDWVGADRAERIRQTRDKEVLRIQRGVTALPPVFNSDVVGVTFVPGYPDNLYALETMFFDAEMAGESLVAVIIRNPENEYDPNACEVHVPSLGTHGMVGHITRPIALRLAAELDQGVRWQGEVNTIRVHPDNPSNPGLTIRLERIT